MTRSIFDECRRGPFYSWRGFCSTTDELPSPDDRRTRPPQDAIDELTYTRDEAAEFWRLVKKRLGAPWLTHPFILRSLVGLRKNGGAKKKAVASLGDGQATE
jgi:hypothetical protein